MPGDILTWEGISLPSYWGGNYQTPSGIATMDLIKANGANTVTLIPNFFQTTGTSNSVHLNANESDTFAQVQRGIQDAVSRGLKVVLKPHVERDDRNVVEDGWRALITPSDPAAWFASYKAMMVEYAKVAQAGGASMIVIGTEMKSMTDPTKSCSDGKTYTQKWIEITEAVRQVFSGKVTYAATDEEALKIQFWDKLDYIGVDAYFSMTNKNDPTVQELIDAWIKPPTNWAAIDIYGTTSVVDTWKQLSEQWGKQVLFTEIGYRSYDGANKAPGLFGGGGTLDLQEQADCYEALFHVVKNYGGRWLGGMFTWSYETDTTGDPPTGYTTQDKPADAIVRNNYSNPPHVAGITRTGTEAAEKLDGGYNNDTLKGAGGSDTLWGGAGSDTFVFDGALNSKTSPNLDRILDYSVADDRILIDNALFSKYRAASKALANASEAEPLALPAKYFALNKAKDRNDFFVFNTKSATLFFDPDGSGRKSAIKIAVFEKTEALTGFRMGELLFI